MGGWVRFVFNRLTAPASLRLLCPSFTSSVSATTRAVRQRAFSNMANCQNNLFDYTTGGWVYNDALRHAERRLVFDVEGLSRLAAQSVGRSPADVVRLSKLAEGGFNRTFLITLRDNFQMVARVPYPHTVPKYYAVASEVATMDFLRASGLPVPQIFGYSPVADNEAKTEYIFMEYARGSRLSDVWPQLGESDMASIMRQLVQLESQMMSISFPAGGSLYYARDLAGRAGFIPLKDNERFCVGPDTSLPMWYGRRSQLKVDRGPYKSGHAALVAVALKELAYLEQFGRPILPFRRERRDAYQYQKQLPSAHIENLKRYLCIAPFLIPRDPALSRFSIRHPYLQYSNIMIQRSSVSGWQVSSLLDWQHASILPMFLLARVPPRLQNHNDPVSQSMTLPSLPDNFHELEEPERGAAEETYHCRFLHYHYVKSTEEYNKRHYDAMTDFMCVLRSRLFTLARYPWEGETFELKLALIHAAVSWEELTGGSAPCPIAFDAEDVRETQRIEEVQREADGVFEVWQVMLGLGPEGWVAAEDFEEAVALSKRKKEELLKEASAVARAEILAHWPWDDMDEENYR